MGRVLPCVFAQKLCVSEVCVQQQTLLNKTETPPPQPLPPPDVCTASLTSRTTMLASLGDDLTAHDVTCRNDAQHCEFQQPQQHGGGSGSEHLDWSLDADEITVFTDWLSVVVASWLGGGQKEGDTWERPPGTDSVIQNGAKMHQNNSFLHSKSTKVLNRRHSSLSRPFS